MHVELRNAAGEAVAAFASAMLLTSPPNCWFCCLSAGAWLPLICTLNCTVPAEEVIAAFGISHAEATALAEAEPAGSSGVSFLPYLVGERTPNWPDSTGAVIGLRPGECLMLLMCLACAVVLSGVLASGDNHRGRRP
jgi:sugar (pentulose or hexulose) kinase